VIVGHFNKNNNVASALDKPGGGRAWTAVPRTAWGFFRSPDNKLERNMCCLKQNNARETENSLKFIIDERQIGALPDGEPWMMPFVEWGGTTNKSADEIIAAEHPDAKRDNKGTDFIKSALADEPRKAASVYEDAEGEGLSEITIKRACAAEGILKYEVPDTAEKYRWVWMWQHPSDSTGIPAEARQLNPAAKARRRLQEKARNQSDLASKTEIPL
jgi:hypothetical protein